MSQSQGNDPALPAATGSDGTGGAAATTDTGAPTAEERDEILKAMMQTGEGGDTSGGGGAPEAGETLVGGGSAVDINEAIFGANSLMARRKAMLEAHKKGLPVVPVSAQVQKHKFWDTQPVKKLHEDEVDEECGPIDEIKTPDQVRQTPYALPKGFEWVSMDVTDETQIAEIYKLLTENYVQDDDAMFRFDYSIPFLQWALTPPGYFKEWHVGVRQCSNGRLRGFISGIPAEVQVYDAHMKMSEINFLCVHQKLRSKRLAPVLIKEVTRRVNLLDQWQAVYTAGVVLPKPVGQCHYYHRSINPKKLIEIGFSRLGPRMTMSRQQKLYKLPSKPQIPGFRQMLPKDVPQVHAMLMKKLATFKLYIRFSAEELAHWVLPRAGVVDSFVVQSPDGNVTDFCSYYFLPSSILKHQKHTKLNAVYSFYNVATSVSLEQLMTDCLIKARDCKTDVFNCLDLLDNSEFLKPLKFGVGDGRLQYYLYNWKCPQMKPSEIGIVLL
eukprot:INCI881.1.p1 GENE.INCI881.1~~INCI881.1.p1  ORF type:complete len:496 (-),score=99.42 INCI881.1:156-1643(-)